MIHDSEYSASKKQFQIIQPYEIPIQKLEISFINDWEWDDDLPNAMNFNSVRTFLLLGIGIRDIPSYLLRQIWVNRKITIREDKAPIKPRPNGQYSECNRMEGRGYMVYEERWQVSPNSRNIQGAVYWNGEFDWSCLTTNRFWWFTCSSIHSSRNCVPFSSISPRARTRAINPPMKYHEGI